MINKFGSSKFNKSPFAMSYGTSSKKSSVGTSSPLALMNSSINKGFNSVGKKSTSALVRDTLTTVKKQTTNYTPKASSFSIKIPANVTSNTKPKKTVIKVKQQKQAPVVNKPSVTKPKNTGQQTPSAYVKTVTPKTTNQIKTSTPQSSSPAAASLQPMGMSMGMGGGTNPRLATFGDKGFEDVMVTIPPIQNNNKGNTVKSKPTTYAFVSAVVAESPSPTTFPSLSLTS